MRVWQDARQHQRSFRKMRLKLKEKFALEKYLIHRPNLMSILKRSLGVVSGSQALGGS